MIPIRDSALLAILGWFGSSQSHPLLHAEPVRGGSHVDRLVRRIFKGAFNFTVKKTDGRTTDNAHGRKFLDAIMMNKYSSICSVIKYEFTGKC